MDPVLAEIYATVIDAAPYVLAAYLLLWLGLFGYMFFVLRRLTGIEREVEVLEESLARRK